MTWFGLPTEIWGAIATIVAAVIGVLGALLFKARRFRSDVADRLSRLRLLRKLAGAVWGEDGAPAAKDPNGARVTALYEALKTNLEIFDEAERQRLQSAMNDIRHSRARNQMFSLTTISVVKMCVEHQIEVVEAQLGFGRPHSA